MNSSEKPFYVGFIDGIRAIAVVAVVIYHLHSGWLPGGFEGVDIFFVVSGFVVATSVGSLSGQRFSQFLLHFYARRLVRIGPALVVCLLATFLLSEMFVPPAWLSQSNRNTGLLAFFGLSNFALAKATGNYFSPTTAFNPFTHTWSLAIEEQFYLLFPLLFYPWLLLRKRFSVAILGACLLLSLGIAIWLNRVDKTSAFYMIWSRFWELGIGVVLYQLMSLSGHSFSRLATRRSPPIRLIGGAIALFLLGLGLIVARSDTAPFPSSLLPVGGTALLIACLHGQSDGLVHRFLVWRPMQFIGRRSYSLYLWHWPIFVIFRWTVGLDQPSQRIAAVASVIVLTLLSYRFIEVPPRRMTVQWRRPIIVTAGLALVFSGCCTAYAMSRENDQLSLSTVVREADNWYPEGPKKLATDNGCAVETAYIPFDGGQSSRFRRAKCAAPATFPHDVYVFGDSHVGAYDSMLRHFAGITGATVHTYGLGGCAFIGLLPLAAAEQQRCEAFQQSALRDVLPRLRPGDVVFLPSLRLPRLIDQWAVYGSASALDVVYHRGAADARAQAERAAIPILQQFQQRGATIVFEAPTPVVETVPFRCSDWFNRNDPICEHGPTVSKALLDQLRAPVLSSYADMSKTVSHMRVWDPYPILCPGKTECSAFQEGKPLYFDGDHLSGFSNRLLLPSFTRFVTQTTAPGPTPMQMQTSVPAAPHPDPSEKPTMLLLSR